MPVEYHKWEVDRTCNIRKTPKSCHLVLLASRCNNFQIQIQSGVCSMPVGVFHNNVSLEESSDITVHQGLYQSPDNKLSSPAIQNITGIHFCSSGNWNHIMLRHQKNVINFWWHLLLGSVYKSGQVGLFAQIGHDCWLQKAITATVTSHDWSKLQLIVTGPVIW